MGLAQIIIHPPKKNMRTYHIPIHVHFFSFLLVPSGQNTNESEKKGRADRGTLGFREKLSIIRKRHT